MPDYRAPGVYVEEIPTGPRPIQAVGTSTAGFVGVAPDPDALLNEAIGIDSWVQFVNKFAAKGEPTPLAQAVYGFFLNGGSRCYVVNVGRKGSQDNAISGGAKERVGLDVLKAIDEVKIVAAPGYSDAGSHAALVAHCEDPTLRDRVAILDPPGDLKDIEGLKRGEAEAAAAPPAAGASAPAPGLHPSQSDDGFATFYFPWILVRDPFNPVGTIAVPPSGHVAGVWARTDATRGVHKAPANETIRGAVGVNYSVTRAEQEELNPIGVNCIRVFGREGVRIWGARTLAAESSEWRYVNVRRLFNMIEESIARSTRWVVFEPNDESLWKSIRRDINAFLLMVWRDGALMGATPEQAFFVKCDADTNPPESINQGRVVIVIGIAPVKPAEFVIFKIGQYAAGSEVD